MGGFYSSQDADSERYKGKFFVWTPEEIAIVGGDAKPLLEVVFGVYRPNQVVAWQRDGTGSVIALLEGRNMIDGDDTETEHCMSYSRNDLRLARVKNLHTRQFQI